MNDPMQRALALPNGARFYQCALQVNPYAYALRHQKGASTFADEHAYNAAMIAACKENGIQVIAITDHYRVQESVSLADAARRDGIHVVPAFEAVTKDGVHVLCLFPVERELASLVSYIGECGVHGEPALSPIGSYDFGEILDAAKRWGALCVAAHAASEGGLLWQLAKQPRVKAWTHEQLLAIALAGPASDAPEALRPILANKNPDYRRKHPVAVINAQDVSSPADFAKPGSSCLLKMSEVSLEGLRQAFLDPRSRIRLNSELPVEPHSELIAIAWEGGGFLDRQGIHFNENLNVLIGGRGAGKSTVVESVRYALGLEPVGEEARAAHEGIIQKVLRPGTKISLLVGTHRPRRAEYRIERTVPNPPVVRDAEGQVLPLSPIDVIPRAEVYGQHEISELARSPEKLTHLLGRFTERDPALAKRKREIAQELRKSRIALLEVSREAAAVEERVDALPALQQKLRTDQDAGLEERLKERAFLVREERLLKTASERFAPVEELVERLQQALPLDRAFLSEKAIEDLPGKEALRQADSALAQANAELRKHADSLVEVVTRAKVALAEARGTWDLRGKLVIAAYEKILRDLQTTKVDAQEFIRIRQQIEELRPLSERQAALARDRKELEQHRRNLLAEWEDVKSAEFQALERASKKVRKALADRVDVTVTYNSNRAALTRLLTENVGGRISPALATLRDRETLSLTELALAMRAGPEALVEKFGLTRAPAEKLAQASAETAMLVEELELLTATKILLNVGDAGGQDFQPLEKLSTGQKATAVLLLLLLDSPAPLIVDQPEDDLDNRFVTEGVVPRIAEQKSFRQFVFATHNANVPVLGDAELIVGLNAKGEAGDGQAIFDERYMASIDSEPIRTLVEELLEGGRAAFETRRLKYNF